MAMEYDYYEQHIHRPGDPIAPAKVRWIWVIFWWLLGVTTIEVSLAFMNFYNTWGVDEVTHHNITKFLKFVYIALTLLKAYFIIFSYMHLKDEKKAFKLTLGFLVIVLTYFIILMMNEGYHQNVVHFDFPEFMQRNPEGGGAH
jgi:hypothetical protein